MTFKTPPFFALHPMQELRPDADPRDMVETINALVVNLRRLYAWLGEFDNDWRTEKATLRDAIREPTSANKQTFTVTNHTSRTSIDADATSVAEIADMLGNILNEMETLRLITAEVS